MKESYAPEIVARAVRESSIPVKTCLDPFGGAGTTALTCQFLGVRPTTVEVQPFLADLIETKLATYDPAVLIADFHQIKGFVSRLHVDPASFFAFCPPTFLEPGTGGKYLFSRQVASKVASYRMAIEELETPIHRRLFTILLGATLRTASNATISGKGRRYRRSWQERPADPSIIDALFLNGFRQALEDIGRFGRRQELGHCVISGDSRAVLEDIETVDLAVFSPPYVNSWDYTDIYNVELWMLGYLENMEENRLLRHSTLSSHVQVRRTFASPPTGSPRLEDVMGALRHRREALWDRQIPNMVGAYFADMISVLTATERKLSSRGEIWMIVADSRYAGVDVPVAAVLQELASGIGFRVVKAETSRSMRLSPQQGGRLGLAETLVVLQKE